MINSTNSITILSSSPILQENRKDPITGDLIKEDDKVVICASCKSAFLEGSWNYLGQQHCQQKETLNQIPAKQNFKFVKKLEQVIFSAENYQGNTALIVAVPTGIISFIISTLLILNVTDLLWLWGVVAGLISIPLIFNAFQNKGVEVKETAIYFKKGFGRRVRVPIAKIKEIDFLYYNDFKHTYRKEGNEVTASISIPYTLKISISRHNSKYIQLSEYDFNKNRAKFLDFFDRISHVSILYLISNNEQFIKQFEAEVTNFNLKKDLIGLRHFYGSSYQGISLKDLNAKNKYF